jgi:hypothetical protein
VALVLFSPVLVWNSRHGWISFGFQIGWRHATSGPFSPRRFTSFLGLQALALTPLLWLVTCVAAVASAWRWREPAWRICALFSLPALAIFVAASPYMWVKGNWAAVAYPSALIAAAALHHRHPRPRLLVASLLTAALGSLYMHLAIVVPALPFPAREDVTTGWKELARRVDAELSRLPSPTFVVGCTYKPASELAYYLPGRPFTRSQDALGEAALQYGFWADDVALSGRQGILVLDDREWKNCLRRAEYCQPLEELEPLTVRRGDRPVTTFRLWRCRHVVPGPGTPR